MNKSGAGGGGVASVIASRIVNALCQALVLVILARLTDISDFGRYSTMVAIGAIAIGVLGFGIPTRVLRLDSNSAALVPTMVAAGAMGSLTSFVILAVLGAIMWPASVLVVFAGAAYAGSELFTNVLQNLLFGEQRVRRAELVLILRRAIPLLGVGVSSVLAPAHIYAALGASFLAVVLVAQVVAGARLSLPLKIRAAVKGSRHYWMTNIWSMLQQLDVVAVSAFISSSAAGAFSAAFRLASPVHIVTTSIVARMVPHMTQAPSLDRSKLGQRYLVGGGIYSLVVAALSPIFALVAPVVLGAQFAPYGALFMLLCLNSAFSVFNQLLSAWFFGTGEPRLVARSTAAATCLGLSTVVGGAVTGSVIIAAVGTLSIQLWLVIFLSVGFVRRRKRKRDQ